MEYGVRSVTMDDIARHLAMSKKTIYLHFKDKKQIIVVATREHFAKEQALLTSIEEQSENAFEALFSMTMCIRQQVKTLKSNLLFDLKKYYPEAWEIYMGFKQDVIYNSMIKNMKRGIAEGLYRSDIDPVILAHLRFGEVELAFNPDYFPSDQFNFMEVHQQMFEHFAYGLLTKQGLKLFDAYKKKEPSIKPVWQSHLSGSQSA
jgi:AcrR family transcriptional regulator